MSQLNKGIIIEGNGNLTARVIVIGDNAKPILSTDENHSRAIQHFSSEGKDKIDLTTLAEELASLHKAMQSVAKSPFHSQAVAEIGAAEEAAQVADEPKVFKHLKSAGKWAFDVASEIGVKLAADAIKKTLSL